MLPESRRGASALSPYIRHGLLPLRRVWDHVAGGPARDVRKFHDELLWQEFSRHWYARLGTTFTSGRPPRARDRARRSDGRTARRMGSVDGVHGRNRGRARQRRLARQPDPHVAVSGLVGSQRVALAGRRGRLLPASPRRVASCEPARLAVDHRRRILQALRHEPVAGREARTGAVRHLRSSRRLSDPGLAGRPRVPPGGTT